MQEHGSAYSTIVGCAELIRYGKDKDKDKGLYQWGSFYKAAKNYPAISDSIFVTPESAMRSLYNWVIGVRRDHCLFYDGILSLKELKKGEYERPIR